MTDRPVPTPASIYSEVASDVCPTPAVPADTPHGYCDLASREDHLEADLHFAQSLIEGHPCYRREG